MKVIAINASPRQNGSTATLVHYLEKKLIEKGHDVKFIPLFDLSFKGCKSCFECSKPDNPICSQQDDLYPILEEINQADAIILGTPIYMGDMSGSAKTFIDRCYTFFAQNRWSEFKKKIFTYVITQGGEIQYFESVRDYFYEWFIEYFKMKSGGSVVAAGVSNAEDLSSQPDIFKHADEIADLIQNTYSEQI